VKLSFGRGWSVGRRQFYLGVLHGFLLRSRSISVLAEENEETQYGTRKVKKIFPITRGE